VSVYVQLKGLVDFEAEIKKLEVQLSTKVQPVIDQIESKVCEQLPVSNTLAYSTVCCFNRQFTHLELYAGCMHAITAVADRSICFAVSMSVSRIVQKVFVSLVPDGCSCS
jgi:hypothetical protein